MCVSSLVEQEPVDYFLRVIGDRCELCRSQPQGPRQPRCFNTDSMYDYALQRAVGRVRCLTLSRQLLKSPSKTRVCNRPSFK